MTADHKFCKCHDMNMKHSFYQPNLRHLLLLLAVVGLSSLKARADIIVEVLDSNVAVNGTGTVDVLVYSEIGDLNIGGLGFAFEILPALGNVGFLEFLDPQLVNETSTVALPYLFEGGGVDSESFVTGKTYLDGFVFFNTTGDFSVLGDDQQLLIRLDVRHTLLGGTDPALALLDTFEISPDIAFFDFADDQDPAGSYVINELASSSGAVQMMSGGPTAVPEPGHMALMLAGVAGAWLRKRRAGLTSKMH